MVLESPDGPLGLIVAVNFWGHQLKLGIPFEHDGLFVGCAGFIVKDLEGHGEAPGGETCHDGVVGGDAVGVSSCLERLLENQIAVGMIGNHYVLVARTGLDRKTTCVICVEFADGNNLDVEFVGVQRWRLRGNRLSRQGRGVGLG